MSSLAIVATMFASFACSKYDNPENVHITAYGSVVRYNGSGEEADYYLRQDDGATLFVKDFWGNELFTTDGQRVKFNYEIMDDAEGTRAQVSGEIYDIRLYYISKVLELDTVALSFIMEDEEHRRDSIGTDPLGQITRMFFSGNYVNVQYTYWKKKNTSHEINLVVDDMNTTEDEVTVYICYNANGDAPESSESGFSREESEVSFNIGSLIPVGKNSIRIRFEWKEFAKGKTTEKMTTRVFSLDPGANKQIVGSL